MTDILLDRFNQYTEHNAEGDGRHERAGPVPCETE